MRQMQQDVSLAVFAEQTFAILQRIEAVFVFSVRLPKQPEVER